MTAIFECPTAIARELQEHELPLLQALFDANPSYFLAVNGQPAPATLAHEEFDELPPPHLGFSRRWFMGLFDRQGELLGVVVVVADLGAVGVWHLALFLVATSRHGSGLAHEVLKALLDWAHGAGACWMRLGVVKGNVRAERFWARNGFLPVRLREGVDTGGRLNDVQVCVRPLEPDAGLAAYLELVPRDRPGSTLP